VITNLDKITQQYAAMLDLLQMTERQIDIEYDQHKEVMNRTEHKETGRFADLIDNLFSLKFIAEIVKAKHRLDEHTFFVSGNAGKAHIVEWAYTPSLWMGAPKFTTTPGSQFSFLCSLIYEIATGKIDESLAGAINRFSLSDERKKCDTDELEAKVEGDMYENDNFGKIKLKIKRLLDEYHQWKRISESRKWTDQETYFLYCRQMDIVERLEENTRHHGPFLVWAHQISPNDLSKMFARGDRTGRTLLAREIRVGRMRRRARRGST
jgi:hypothetical protein